VCPVRRAFAGIFNGRVIRDARPQTRVSDRLRPRRTFPLWDDDWTLCKQWSRLPCPVGSPIAAGLSIEDAKSDEAQPLNEFELAVDRVRPLVNACQY
jgi:hypothetical protein